MPTTPSTEEELGFRETLLISVFLAVAVFIIFIVYAQTMKMMKTATAS